MRTEHHAAGETAKGGARPENPEISKAILDLKGLQRWVCWKQVPKPGKDGVIKLAKVPIALDGSSEGWTNPQKWGTLAQCLAKKKAEALNGVGFVFNGDGIVGIDIDGCRNPATGEISDWGKKIIEDINSYTEISPSGTGVKILLRTQGAVPFAKKRRELEGLPAIQGKAPGVEMFASAGYFTITGRHLSGTPKELRDATHAVTRLASWLTETERKAEAPKKEVDLNNPYTFINSEALKRPDLWVLELFPEAIAQGNGGYRVSSAALGRGLEEDLSIHPQGIKDFGLHDQPDETRQGKRTAVDLVMEHGGAANAMLAARWLAEQLGLEEELEAKFAAYRTKHNAEQRKQTLEGIRQKLEAVGHDAKHLFARLILEADLTPVEEDEILALVEKLTKVGKRVLREELENAKRKERARRADEAAEHDAAMMGKVRRPVPDKDAERTPVIADIEQVFSEGAPELFQNVMGDVVYVCETKSALLHLMTSETNAGSVHADMFAPPPASMLIQAHTVESLRAVIERRIRFEDRRKGQARPVTLPEGHLCSFLAQRQTCGLPLITAISDVPVMTPNGRLIVASGFDRESGIYFTCTKEEAAGIVPERTDAAAVRDAYAFLAEDLFCDVQVEDKVTGTAALIAFLATATVQPVLGEKPIIIIKASQRGSGKTTAVNLITRAVTRRAASAAAWARTEEERRKTLFSVAREGHAVLLLDNIPRGETIRDATLERFSTSAEVRDRVLGESRTESVRTPLIALTGNALRLGGDAGSRALQITLCADRPDPENRSFRHPDILGWVDRNRAKILRAIMTIMMGNPTLHHAGAKLETRFPAWYLMVGSAIEHAAKLYGHEVRMVDLFRASEAEDDSTDNLAKLVSLLQEAFPSQTATTFTVEELVKRINTAFPDDRLAEELSDAINGLSKTPLKAFDTRSVGAALQHHVKDRPIAVDGEVWKLTAAPRTSGKDKIKWKLERIGSGARDDDDLSDLL